MAVNIGVQSQPWFLGLLEMCSLMGMGKKEGQAWWGPGRLPVNNGDSTLTAFFGVSDKSHDGVKIISQGSLTVQRCTAIGRSLMRRIREEDCESQVCQYLKQGEGWQDAHGRAIKTIEPPERLIYDQGSRSYIHFTVSQQSKGRKGMVVGFFAKPSLGEW